MKEDTMVFNYDLNIEESILGLLIEHPNNVYKLNEYPATIFYSTKNQNLLEAMRKLLKDNKTFDLETLLHHISKNKIEYLTISYVSDLVGRGVKSQFKQYVDILLDMFNKRIMQKALMEIDYTENSVDIKSKILNALNTVNLKTDEVPMCDVVMNTLDRVMSGEVKKGVSTGVREIDENLLGFNAGELITIAARSGIGKTTFALNTFTHQVMRGYKAQYFSLEMPTEEIIKKMLSIQGRIESSKLRKNAITDSGDMDKLARLGNMLASKQFKVYDKNSNLEYIETKIREEYIKGNLDIVYIDLVNRVTHKDKTGSRAEYVGHITRTFKQIALELKIPIVILAQINRGAEQRQDKRPMLSDLKESGSIEEDSDVVISLYRNLKTCDKNYTGERDYSSNNPDKNPCRVEVEILKSRYCGNALLCMNYEAEFGRITDLMR